MAGGHFAAMERNANQLTDFFRLPVDQVVEIGRKSRFRKKDGDPANGLSSRPSEAQAGIAKM